MNQPIIVTTPEQIAALLAPHLERAFQAGLEAAERRGSDPGRLLKYEEARDHLGMGTTMFSRAVSEGALPYVLSGRRKLFRKRDLDNFGGYKPVSEAEAAFQRELENRPA
jgi:hypothetical protein